MSAILVLIFIRYKTKRQSTIQITGWLNNFSFLWQIPSSHIVIHRDLHQNTFWFRICAFAFSKFSIKKLKGIFLVLILLVLRCHIETMVAVEDWTSVNDLRDLIRWIAMVQIWMNLFSSFWYTFFEVIQGHSWDKSVFVRVMPFLFSLGVNLRNGFSTFLPLFLNFFILREKQFLNTLLFVTKKVFLDHLVVMRSFIVIMGIVQEAGTDQANGTH